MRRRIFVPTIRVYQRIPSDWRTVAIFYGYCGCGL